MTNQSTLEEIRARANKRAAVSDVRVDAYMGDSPLATYARNLERDRSALLRIADAFRAALLPLVRIADAYDANELDDEARKFWGKNGETQNSSKPENVELYSGRGGRRLLTLADAFAARDALIEREPPVTSHPDGFSSSGGQGVTRDLARDLARDLDYLSQADAHADEGPLGEAAARSILRIASYWAKQVFDASGVPNPRSAAIAEMAEGLERMSARAAKLEAVYAALRTWPIFADGKEITPELVSQEGLDKVVLEGTFDANVDRLKACEAIALGEQGWESLANECPSAAAVAALRRKLEKRNAYGELLCEHGQPFPTGCNPCQRKAGTFDKDGWAIAKCPIIANQTDAVTASLLGIGKAWSAFREGSVLGDSIGWGATREAAEADLRAKEELI